MNVKQAGLVTLGLAAAVAAGLILHTSVKKPTPFPNDKIRGMQFPVGLSQVVGGKDGAVCHGLPQLGAHHNFPALDWKTATEKQKEAWVIEETLRDAEGGQIACVRPDGTTFLHRAYAGNKICQDPNGCGSGGSCISWSCPAELKNSGNCTVPGPDCVLTYFCCEGPCVASC